LGHGKKAARRRERKWRGIIRDESALDHIYRLTATRSFLVFVLHVAVGVAHGLDDLVERHAMLAVAAYGHALGVYHLTDSSALRSMQGMGTLDVAE
jgi:hypothetical protein